MKRNIGLESCLLESEGDTEDDVDTDGTDTHTIAISHLFLSSFTDKYAQGICMEV